MQPTSKTYEDVALAYLLLVRKESVKAATIIEMIRFRYGYHAALRAALIIVLFKIEVTENHWIPGVNIYAYLLEDAPDAVPLLKRAMTCCAQAWAIQDRKLAVLQTSAAAHERD